MTRRDIEKKLKKAGFRLERKGSKHDIWFDGHEKLFISRGLSIAPTTERYFLVRLKRAEDRKNRTV